MRLINKELLSEVCERAKNSERLRMNHNFHDNLTSPVQRLLNALQPGTNVPIHRHQQTAETYIILQGRIKVLFYNDSQNIEEVITLDVSTNNFGVHIPAGQWHTIEVLTPDSVIFEVKDGPYFPIKEEDILFLNK